MKKTISILLITLCGFAYGQQTIYVKSATDKRLIAYRDSLSRWADNEKMKRLHIAKLDAAANLYEYDKVATELGYVNTQNPTTNDKKCMWDSPQKNKLSAELLTCFHSRGGDISCIYTSIVPKPIIIVEYRQQMAAKKPAIKPAEQKPPVRYITTRHIKIDAHMDTVVDVSERSVMHSYK